LIGICPAFWAFTIQDLEQYSNPDLDAKIALGDLLNSVPHHEQKTVINTLGLRFFPLFAHIVEQNLPLPRLTSFIGALNLLLHQ
jgi:hypothetical protein